MKTDLISFDGYTTKTINLLVQISLILFVVGYFDVSGVAHLVAASLFLGASAIVVVAGTLEVIINSYRLRGE